MYVGREFPALRSKRSKRPVEGLDFVNADLAGGPELGPTLLQDCAVKSKL